MRYFFLGLLPGIIINLFIFSPPGAASMSPLFTSGIGFIENIERAAENPRSSSVVFPVRTDGAMFIVNGEGTLVQKADLHGFLTGFSGNGQYYIRYEKTGKDVDFFNLKGERFWKQKSREYPYLSFSGKLLFLMNGDHSAVRILDHNGNEIGAGRVMGRLCTVISFAQGGDAGGIGFLDGSYYIIGRNGAVLAQGITEKGTMIKGIAVSDDGSHAGIHFGSSEKDGLIILTMGEEEVESSRIYELPSVHVVKTAMHISDAGRLLFLDRESLLVLGSNGKLRERVEVPAKKDGQCDIREGTGFFSVCYSMQSGGSLFLAAGDDGTVFYRRAFPGESFLSSNVQGSFILLRGSDNLFCYNLLF